MLLLLFNLALYSPQVLLLRSRENPVGSKGATGSWLGAPAGLAFLQFLLQRAKQILNTPLLGLKDYSDSRGVVTTGQGYGHRIKRGEGREEEPCQRSVGTR